MKKKTKKSGGKPARKHPGGRPPKFKTVQELEKKIEDYFASCFETHNVKRPEGKKKLKSGKIMITWKIEKVTKQIRPFTITGLALALDTTRETILDYEKDNPNFKEFSDTIRRAKLRCENYAEEHLFSTGQVTGAMFSMKNNYPGWKEKQEIEHTSRSLTQLAKKADELDEAEKIEREKKSKSKK